MPFTVSGEKRDKHFPLFAHNNPLRRFTEPPEKLIGPHVSEGDTVADLGCGPGFYTIPMARLVGPRGRVYAVDSDEKAIRAVIERAAEGGYTNIEARAQSAHDLGFIDDGSVDFILAHGLLCSMAPRNHMAAAGEMNRVLKPGGRAYLSAARGWYSHMGDERWEEILVRFSVQERRDGNRFMGDRCALVSKL